MKIAENARVKLVIGMGGGSVIDTAKAVSALVTNGGLVGMRMKRVNENDMEYRFGDWGPKYLVRGPKIDWGVILLKPGESLGRHFHKEVEETFFFLSGTPTFKANGEEYRVKEGDAFIMEPDDRHDIENNTDRPVKMVFIKCPYLPKDKVSC